MVESCGHVLVRSRTVNSCKICDVWSFDGYVEAEFDGQTEKGVGLPQSAPMGSGNGRKAAVSPGVENELVANVLKSSECLS